MNDDRSLERAARSWLEEGPTRAPDRPVDAALTRIQTTRQERDWIPWRFPNMSPAIKLAGAAIVAVIAIGGSLYLFGSPSGFGGRPTLTPSAAPATPAATPSAAATPGPTPNDAACQLLTNSEVAASSSISLDVAPRARATTTATSDCTYTTGGGIGDIVATVELTKPGGAAAFDAAKAIAGVQTVQDLGTQAVYDPAWDTLYLLKGDTLVSISAGHFQETAASQLAQVTTLARLVIPRM